MPSEEEGLGEGVWLLVGKLGQASGFGEKLGRVFPMLQQRSILGQKLGRVSGRPNFLYGALFLGP